ncbi:MAG: 30S ribosomal protein S4 [Elusimicrobia bacterium]|nr:30S ribosomal protein S4 [Elusimicrobiota bacterium]
MSNLHAPVCRRCRREGAKLFLKGEKCFIKCVVEKRPFAPGRAGKSRTRKKTTDYGIRLREKQKLKKMLGINEAKMKLYYERAQRMPGRTGENLLKLVEMRLDNVARRLGLATSPRFARQLVGHGHVLIGGRRITVPSYEVKPGDILELKGLKNNFFVDLSRQNFERRGGVLPGWLNWDSASQKGRVLRLPEKGELSFPINDQYIVEFYTRR